jgi:hypothetical protein
MSLTAKVQFKRKEPHVMTVIRTKTCLSVVSAGLAVSMSISPAWPQNNPLEADCHRLSTMTMSQLTELAASNNPFWADVTAREAYLAALHGGEDGVMSFKQRHALNLAAESTILLASIVRHDLPLMEENYQAGIDSYYADNQAAGILVAASRCNFYEGVKFMLDRGLSPNPGNATANAGPFNYSLLYKHSKIPGLLLAYGYEIELHYNWCLSSKYILRRTPNNIEGGVAEQIKSANCYK